MTSSTTSSTTAADRAPDPAGWTDPPPRPRAPDPPPRWTAEHVGSRLVDAFRTLDKLPRPKGPRQAGNHWPRHSVEWADQLAQAELPEAERRAREKRQNDLALRPGGTQIAQMDVMLDWLRILRAKDADAALLLTLWALRTARRRPLRRLAAELGISPPTFYKRRDLALARLAEMLEANPVPVF